MSELIAKYGVDVVKTIVELIVEGVRGTEPPQLEELAQRIEEAVKERNAVWIAQAKAAADAEFNAAANAAHAKKE